MIICLVNGHTRPYISFYFIKYNNELYPLSSLKKIEILSPVYFPYILWLVHEEATDLVSHHKFLRNLILWNLSKYKGLIYQNPCLSDIKNQSLKVFKEGIKLNLSGVNQGESQNESSKMFSEGTLSTLNLFFDQNNWKI